MAALDINRFLREQFSIIFNREITDADQLRIRELAAAFGVGESKSLLVEMIHKYYVECMVRAGSAQTRSGVAKLHIELMEDMREQASSDRVKLFKGFMDPVQSAAIWTGVGMALGILVTLAIIGRGHVSVPASSSGTEHAAADWQARTDAFGRADGRGANGGQ